MNTRTNVNIARILVRLNNINRDIVSRGVYLSIVERDDVAGGDDDVPMQSSEKWAIVEVGAVVQRALPKTLFVLSRCRIVRTRVSETCSLECQCMQTIRMERLQRPRSSQKRKILIDYLRIFQLELIILVFVVSFPRRTDVYIYTAGYRITYSVATLSYDDYYANLRDYSNSF
jgi:hypothetical protein